MKTEITINDADLASLKDKVVVVTGGSCGIGLATVNLLVSLGAFVVSGDIIAPPPTSSDRLIYQRTDVTSWTELSALFKKAKALHGRIDHVFANAGIPTRTTYTEDAVDENGDLLEPSHRVVDVDLRAVINTTALAVFYMKPERQQGGGSITLTASATSFQRFRGADYAVAKHGVLGLMRGVQPNLRRQGVAVRVNTVNPSWTATGIVPAGLLEAIGARAQAPEAVARSVGLLMADAARDGQALYSVEGRVYEVEQAVLLPAAAEGIVGTGGSANAGGG
ncbi:putative short-chain dehydrogenase reductase sdr protein [Neofusicoccum parvum UCRNP2]|uniref:Putative short-chain dehydrogenase reductase sdr protein n=1 Tax=Botryosphaeria parva (strain UCR-NP2) TaxID=1287680 RepID=R1ECJ1_BOTPV|nr:putative short-chain dehydrogenase reductase sdr protein [Neofusicoccum parvum UCRNP2]